ncbi:unnamed protein product [Prorocentrum cordatum]|uniref:Uncharacterized protein n=1 Tax=Prorocentrum cordatum TaxID=2364126 RepID=A0ABN9WIX8_9DINO|nr:unnamed protein product [Polarella glacialis]
MVLWLLRQLLSLLVFLPLLLLSPRQAVRPPRPQQGGGGARATFCKQEAHFDTVHHLPVFEAAAYLDPSLRERDRPLEHGLKAMRQAGSLAEIVAFASGLDRSRMLYLAKPDEVNLGQARKLIPVYRDQQRDRIVWDRRIRNAAEHALQSCSQRLVSGHALREFELQGECAPVLFAKDASGFYPSFDAPPAKARTNVLARMVPTHLLRHTRAYADRPAELGEHCEICGASQQSAIDFAQGAHEAVPQAGGPEGGGDKRVAGVAEGFALGAEVLSAGHIGAERLRRAWLALRSSGIAAVHGITTDALLRRTVASWVHVVGFRRPAMCLLDEVFRALPEVTRDDDAFTLGAGARQELMLLAMLAPALVTNLKAKVAPRVVCSDASHLNVAAVVADVEQPIVREIWRHRDQRGWYTQLNCKEVAYIRAHKRLEDRAQLQDIDEELRPDTKVPRWHLLEVFDIVEVCIGQDAPGSKAHAAAGLRMGPRIDPKTHPTWDLRSTRTVEWFLFLIMNERVAHVHYAPPCIICWLARQPCLRSRTQPLGFDAADGANQLGNVLLCKVLLILWTARKYGARGSFEHPAGAHTWHAPAVKTLLGKAGWGTLEKPTRLGLVRADFLLPLARPCEHGRKARSRPLLGAARTAPAAAYSDQLCAVWAELSHAHLAKAGGPSEPAPARADAAGRLEQPFVNDLIRRCRWRAFCCDPCPPAVRINRLEIRARMRARSRAARQEPCARQPFLLDSTVALGACAMGRSASHALINADLELGLPDVLGFDFYPSYDFAPTRLIPADGPSRGRAIAPPSAAPPTCRALAGAGSLDELDQWTRVPRQRRAESEWRRLFVKLVQLRQLKEFDSTLGYPGEGPWRAAWSWTASAAVMLGFVLMAIPGAHGARMASEAPAARPAAHLLHGLRTTTMTIAVARGQVLDSRDRSLKLDTETINAEVGVERSLRWHRSAAGVAAQARQFAAPTRHRYATPRGWIDMAEWIVLACMLRPGGALGLCLAGRLLPARRTADLEACFVRAAQVQEVVQPGVAAVALVPNRAQASQELEGASPPRCPAYSLEPARVSSPRSTLRYDAQCLVVWVWKPL